MLCQQVANRTTVIRLILRDLYRRRVSNHKGQQNQKAYDKLYHIRNISLLFFLDNRNSTQYNSHDDQVLRKAIIYEFY
jgi:hypothetical protein